MNIKIIDGYVTVDGIYKTSASYKLFTKEGIDICIPSPKQPETQPAPADPWTGPDLRCYPKEKRTMGRHDIAMLLESLARRCDRYGSTASAEIYRAEKENWK